MKAIDETAGGVRAFATIGHEVVIMLFLAPTR